MPLVLAVTGVQSAALVVEGADAAGLLTFWKNLRIPVPVLFSPELLGFCAPERSVVEALFEDTDELAEVEETGGSVDVFTSLSLSMIITSSSERLSPLLRSGDKLTTGL